MKVRTKDIGLNMKQPKADCKSTLCPWHGNLRIRGRIFTGKVVSTKPMKTAVVEWNFYTYMQKFERYQRKNTKISVHNPDCISANVGDTVTIGECRPISKTKKFAVLEKVDK